MKHFYLIVNREKAQAEKGAGLIKEYLDSQGCECLMGSSENPGSPEYRYTDGRAIPKETECVIVLGGDGTLIQAARDLAERNIPLFGVNMGTLGYLTQISREEEIIPGLKKLIKGDYQLEDRMMLQGRVKSKGKTIDEDIALNDIVLSRAGLYTLQFELYVDGQMFNSYTADGMIIATPTGSTAYNLSAGGPIVAPEANLILLTPICPHTLNSRGIVLPAQSKITLKINGRENIEESVSFDGDTMVQLKAGDEIEIECSEIRTTLIKLRDVSFLENIRCKMRQI